MATRLTDRFITSLALPERDQVIHYDGELTGFGLRITRAGAKAFILNYRAKRRERRYTIGSYPTWSVASARKKARDLRRQIDNGEDPMEQRHLDRAAETMADLAERYLEEHGPRKRSSSLRNDRQNIRNYILPALARRTVKDITFRDIDQLHQSMKAVPYQANRVLSLLSHMMAMASSKWGLREDNPCRGVIRFPEDRRERYLTEDEVKRIAGVMDKLGNQSAGNAVRLLLLTGARKGEVLAARWDQFDLERAYWHKSSAHTKQKRQHDMPLSAAAIDLLRAMHRESESIYLFPGRDGGHLKDLRSYWKRLRETAGINSDIRIHDLRHTFASLLASSGEPIAVVGRLLGHTQAHTTQRYTHLFERPLRDAVEKVGDLFNPAAGKSPGSQEVQDEP